MVYRCNALASDSGLVLPRMLHLGKNAHIVATKTQVEALHLMVCWILYRYCSFESSRGIRNGKYASSISFCCDYWTCLFGYQGKTNPFVNLCDSIYQISILLLVKLCMWLHLEYSHVLPRFMYLKWVWIQCFN